MAGGNSVHGKDACYRLSRLAMIIACLLTTSLHLLMYLLIDTERDGHGGREPAVESSRLDVHLYFWLCWLSLLVGAVGAWRQKYACLFTGGINLLLLGLMALAIDHPYLEAIYLAVLGLLLLVFSKYKNKGGCCLPPDAQSNA